jgi:NTP pyrophosphatase (non-canonical NTP hydrolase)
MNPSDYQKAAIRTECDQNISHSRLHTPDYTPVTSYTLPTPIRTRMVRLNHSIMGLSAEAGELQQLFLKLIYYGKPFTEEMRLKMIEEFGDALWFIAQGLTVLGKDMGEVMAENIAKLKARFPDKFTEELSANRNEAKEKESIAKTSIKFTCAIVGHSYEGGVMNCIRCGKSIPIDCSAPDQLTDEEL